MLVLILSTLLLELPLFSRLNTREREKKNDWFWAPVKFRDDSMCDVAVIFHSGSSSRQAHEASRLFVPKHWSHLVSGPTRDWLNVSAGDKSAPVTIPTKGWNKQKKINLSLPVLTEQLPPSGSVSWAFSWRSQHAGLLDQQADIVVNTCESTALPWKPCRKKEKVCTELAVVATNTPSNCVFVLWPCTIIVPALLFQLKFLFLFFC